MDKKKISLGLAVCCFLTILFPLRLYFDLIGMTLIFLLPLNEFPGYILKYFLLRPPVILLQIGCIVLGAGLLDLKKWAVNGVLLMNWFAVLLGALSLFLPRLPIPLAGKIEIITVGLFFIWFFEL